MANFSQYFAIETKIKKQGFDTSRTELITQFTAGRKSGLSELGPFEYKEFLKWLQTTFNPASKPIQDIDSPENKMRRKIIALFKHKMGYSMQELDRWCIASGKYKKRLQEHSHAELTVLVTQAQAVYESYVKSINPTR